MIQIPYYEFRQNNSGGSFDYDEMSGISTSVIIEADNYIDANERAEVIGLYFWTGEESLNSYTDCHCCGDRWNALGSWDEPGDDVPSHYGTPLEGIEFGKNKGLFDKGSKWMKGDKFEFFVHYKDGGFQGYGKE